MPEQRVLPHTTAAQINGYYCGPAALANALKALGISVSQQTLAGKLKTTTAGTNSVSNIDEVYDAYVRPGVNDFEPVFIRGNDVTADEAAAFRRNIVKSIDAGYPVVVNVVGSAVDVDGARHTYSGGHYVTVFGYRHSGAQMLIGDPAIGRDYWMTTDRLDTWTAARGYVWAAHVPEGPLAPAVVNPGDPFPLPSGYFGDIDGPAESHGGFYDTEKPWIMAIQLKLVDLGHARTSAGAAVTDPKAWADGRYEQPTIDAVKRFQHSAGLVVDGKVGPLTWRALFPPVDAEQPAPAPWPTLPPATSLEEMVSRARTVIPLGTVPYDQSRAAGTLDCSWYVAIIAGIANAVRENTVTLLTRGHVRPITWAQTRPGDLWGKLGADNPATPDVNEDTSGDNGHVAVIVATPSTSQDGKWHIIHQTSSSAPGPNEAVFAAPPAGFAPYRVATIPDPPPALEGSVALLSVLLRIEDKVDALPAAVAAAVWAAAPPAVESELEVDDVALAGAIATAMGTALARVRLTIGDGPA